VARALFGMVAAVGWEFAHWVDWQATREHLTNTGAQADAWCFDCCGSSESRRCGASLTTSRRKGARGWCTWRATCSIVCVAGSLHPENQHAEVVAALA
jgi:hypothetical protein